jgi:hypothetical protein
MKINNWARNALSAAFVCLASVLAGCTTYVESPQPYVVNAPPPVYEQPAPEYVEPAPAPDAVVVIQADSDFYEPLSQYGRWIDVQGNGRCWVPAGVDRDWRPYTDGHWERTDAGWYWVSDERWGWATYHYGRWFQDPDNGWVWVPQTQWAPAWVAWREGGGYTGWAPLPPEAKIEDQRSFESVDPHAFVFVDERRMLEPQRHQDVIINNTTIINNTVNITKIQVVNKTVINEGPSPDVIARASGRKVEAVAAKTLRTRQEAPAIIARGNNPPPSEKRAQSMQPNNGEPAQKLEPVARTVETSPEKARSQEPSVVPPKEKGVPGEVKRSMPDEARKPAPNPPEVVKTPVKPVPPRVEPDRPPKPAVQPEVRQEQKPQTEPGPDIRKPTQPEHTPQTKPAQAPKQKVDEKRKQDEKSGSSPDTQPRSQ